MSRAVFSIVVPLLALLLGAILFANAITLGFAGEGCRFHDGKGLRWSAAGEAILMQLIFGIGFALAFGILCVVLRQRLASLYGASGRGFEWAGIGSFVLLSIGAVLGAMACRLQPYDGVGRVIVMGAVLTFFAALALLLISYVRGLSIDR